MRSDIHMKIPASNDTYTIISLYPMNFLLTMLDASENGVWAAAFHRDLLPGCEQFD